MKLRNKKTGKVGWLYEHSLLQDIIIVYDVKGIVGKYTSIAELNEEWEDYEEPKEYWFISTTGVVHRFEGEDKIYTPGRKQIGNYFETREEAEKVVEKLKAVKRLKDKGFKLKSWYMPKSILKIEIDGGFPEDVYLCDVIDDLDIIFGGE